MVDIKEFINHCTTLQDLKFFLRHPIYFSNRDYWFALLSQHTRLICQDPTQASILPQEFWDAAPADFLCSMGESIASTQPDVDSDSLFLSPEQWPQQQGGAEEVDLHNFYHLGVLHNRRLPNFNTDAQTAALLFRNLDQAADVNRVLAAVLNEVLRLLLEDLGDNPSVLIGLTVHHPALDHPLTIPFSRRDQITGEIILRELERLQQSSTTFSLDENLRIDITRIVPPTGSGHRSWDFRGKWQPWFTRHCGNGGCFIQIKNQDRLCCARAIVTAKARLLKDKSADGQRRYDRVRKGDHHRDYLQRNEARDLMQAAGLGDFDGACGLPELKKLQEALGQDYQIKVFWKENFNKVLYQGPAAPGVIHLYLHHNHYDVITSVAAFFNVGYYCDECNKKFDHKEDHRCAKKCYSCMRIGPDFPCTFDKWTTCPDCHRHFPSRICFDAHRTKKATTVGRGSKRQKTETSVCQRIQLCMRCGKTVYERNQKGERHRCGQTFCGFCRRYCAANHKCYMQVIEERTDDDQKPTRFIFFDLECRAMENVLGQGTYGPIYEHIPNLCVVQRACDRCKDTFDAGASCQDCGSLQKIFKGEHVMHDFCEWLFSTENKDCIVIAHNSKGYDSQFIMQYLHEQAIKPNIILTGRKVIMLKACGVKIVDSLNYLPMPLDGFPKAFGLGELKKGFFPHGFNRRENEGYIGAWPPIDDYWPKLMKAEKRSKFEEWYDQQRGKQFNFDNELLDYCVSDVTLLRQGCLNFRSRFQTVSDVDPFAKATTIASACNYVYRRNFLQPDTLALIPNGGYRRKDKQSVKAIKWFKWLNHAEDFDIQHALNGGEVRIRVF